MPHLKLIHLLGVKTATSKFTGNQTYNMNQVESIYGVIFYGELIWCILMVCLKAQNKFCEKLNLTLSTYALNLAFTKIGISQFFEYLFAPYLPIRTAYLTCHMV